MTDHNLDATKIEFGDPMNIWGLLTYRVVGEGFICKSGGDSKEIAWPKAYPSVDDGSWTKSMFMSLFLFLFILYFPSCSSGVDKLHTYFLELPVFSLSCFYSLSQSIQNGPNWDSSGSTRHWPAAVSPVAGGRQDFLPGELTQEGRKQKSGLLSAKLRVQWCWRMLRCRGWRVRNSTQDFHSKVIQAPWGSLGCTVWQVWAIKWTFQ